MRKVWVFNPHAGGKKISPGLQEEVRRRILEHVKKNYSGKRLRIDIRFRGAMCYIDAYQEPSLGRGHPTASLGESREEYVERIRNIPIHFCRLRHFDRDRWSLAFYTYSNERYEPCLFPSGDWFGTPEEGFDVGAQYLD